MRLRLAVGGGILAVIALGLAARHYQASIEADASASASALAALSADPFGSAGISGDQLPQDAKDVMGTKSLADAIAAAKPHMSDTRDQLDEGSAMLAMWAAGHMTWSALDALPETTPALFKKDPDFERGRRLCATGKILEIRAETDLTHRMQSDHALPLVAPDTTATAPTAMMAAAQPDAGTMATGDGGMDLGLGLATPPPPTWVIPDKGKVFFAVVTTAVDKKGNSGSDDLSRLDTNTPPPLVVTAIAVKSTGTLVDGDTARICGVLTGVNEIDADTGNTLAHRVVGMFDLPENHATGPTAAK